MRKFFFPRLPDINWNVAHENKIKVNQLYRSVFINTPFRNKLKKKNPFFFKRRDYRHELYKTFCFKKEFGENDKITYNQYRKIIWRNINKPKHLFDYLKQQNSWELPKIKKKKILILN